MRPLAFSCWVVLVLTACDDSLPPADDRGVQADADVDVVDKPDARVDLLSVETSVDADCVRPDGFCRTNNDCDDDPMLICNADEVCKPDPCCQAGPETCETICTGACVARVPPLEAQIVKASAWYIQEPSVEQLTQAELTLQLVNSANVTLVDLSLVDTRLISQNNAAKVEVLQMVPLDVVVTGHDTLSVTVRNAPSAASTGGKWSCSDNEQVKIATVLEYGVKGQQERLRTKELWSQVFPFECRQTP